MNPLLPHAPAAGFDEPLEMLHACHERVQRTLALLDRLGEHLERHGADEQARSAAADVLRYFDLAAPLHHEDEERHVFPALRDGGQAALADALQAEHTRMAAEWAVLRTELLAVRDGTVPAGAPLADVRRRWAGFAALYDGHIRAEEAQAYPAAGARLSPEQVQAMGDDMATRRGVAARRR